jgi:hypothetical protein
MAAQSLSASGARVSDFMEIDPITGIKSEFKWNDNDQQYTILRSADVEPVLDRANEVRNEFGKNTGDMKNGWWMYASIPPIVICQMRAKGINIFDKGDQKRMFEEINTNYPHLKMTTGREGGKVKTFVG